MQIHELISPARVTHTLSASSKKRLLEKISALLHEGEPLLDENAAFQSLLEREKLGSTGIGHGVALPHGRLKGLSKAIGAFVRLDDAMEYESTDREPVRLIFALLVPENATDEHLALLSELASLFNKQEIRAKLLEAHDNEEIYQCLTTQKTD